MKKALSFFAFSLLLMTLMSCDLTNTGVGGTNHFKEYSFSKTANEEQVVKIVEGLQKNVKNLSGLTTKTEYNYKAGSEKTTQTSEITAKVLEDSSKPNLLIITATGTENDDRSSDGIKYNAKTSVNYSSWDSGLGYRYTLAKTTTNGVDDEDFDATSITGDSKEYKESTIAASISLPSSSATYYVNTDGTYNVVNSDISKHVTGVEWGNGVKEYITIEKTQTAYLINSEFKLVSYYSYRERSANRDQQTGEWLSSAQVYYRDYTSVEYRYGKRESGSIATLNQSVANKIVPVSLSVYSYSATTTEPFSQFNDTGSQEDSYSCYEESKNRYRFNATVYSNYNSTTFYALRFELNGTALNCGTGQVSSIKYDMKLAQDPNVSSVTNYLTIAKANNHVYFANTYVSSSVSIQVYFTLSGTTVTIDTVNLY